jgi:hypothetical protein
VRALLLANLQLIFKSVIDIDSPFLLSVVSGNQWEDVDLNRFSVFIIIIACQLYRMAACGVARSPWIVRHIVFSPTLSRLI